MGSSSKAATPRCQGSASPSTPGATPAEAANRALLVLALFAAAALDPYPAQAGPWKSMFDGQQLGRWQVLARFDYKDHGKVHVDGGNLVLEQGDPGTGVRWNGLFPKVNYEVTLDAKRVEGDDFFCAITFPVDDDALTLVLGGWDGTVVGLSSIDDEPAVENETCQLIEFKRNRWYSIRLRVSEDRVQAWVDDRQIVDLETEGRKFTLYWEVEPCLPFGLATWHTTGAIRNIRFRRLGDSPAAPSSDRE